MIEDIIEEIAELAGNAVIGNVAGVAAHAVSGGIKTVGGIVNGMKNGHEWYTVIKNNRPGNEMIWKFEKEDFNNGSKLIVQEGEEALFIRDGVIVQRFTAGKYTLETQNYPFITTLKSTLSGGISQYNCKIYFIDKTHQLEMTWGTDTPIQIRDAEYGFAVGVRARGTYSLQIADGNEFFVKLSGDVGGYSRGQIKDGFKTVCRSKIKSNLAQFMKKYNYTVLDMSAELENIANMVKEQLIPVFAQYGLNLVNFYVEDISIPSDDPNYQIINQAYAKAHAGRIEIQVQDGNTWNKLTAKELLKDIANNEGAGGMENLGAGLGVGAVTAGVFTNLADQIFSTVKDENINVNDKKEEKIKCPNCGTEVSSSSKFCNNCGSKLPQITYCKNCGNKLEEKDKFCPKCGTKKEE